MCRTTVRPLYGSAATAIRPARPDRCRRPNRVTRCAPPAEAEGLEPPRACARRISSAVPYQLGLRLQTEGAWARAHAPSPVGETGFEPATPASRTQCSTGLSYSPSSRPSTFQASLPSTRQLRARSPREVASLSILQRDPPFQAPWPRHRTLATRSGEPSQKVRHAASSGNPVRAARGVRTGWDSNPRGLSPHTISNRAP